MNGTATTRRALLWDVSADFVDAPAHRDFLVGRVLGFGSVDDIRALRGAIGDAALRDYLERTTARKIDRRRVRYLEAILGLERARVESWLASPHRRVWDER